MFTYLDFDLAIEPIDPAQSAYLARVLESPAGQGQNRFTLSMSLESTRDLIEGLYTQRVQRSALTELGSQLYRAVFAGEMARLLAASLRQANEAGHSLRVRLQLTQTPELAELPWEYLYDPDERQDFLFMTVETSLVRYLDLPTRKPMAIDLPLNVLVLIPEASDLPGLDVEREWANLNEAMRPHLANGKVAIELLKPASLAHLQQRLRQAEYHILHFIGHGAFDEKQDDSLLMLVDETDNRGQPISARMLGKLLYDESSLRLVVLNTCEGGRTSPTNYFAGAAQNLVKSGVPAVIAMQSVISDRAAIEFSRDFYGALSDGYPVDAALTEGRKAIFTRQSETEWGIPALYSRVKDGQLLDFNLAPDETPAASEEPASQGVSGAPAGASATRKDPGRPQQIWFVPATSKQYDWDQAFKEGRVRWTGVGENEAQQNIRTTHDGDLVIAYRSTPDKYITGLGHVAGEPFEITAEKRTRHAVEIAMDLRLAQSVSLDELRAAVPDLQHVQRQRPIGWSPVTPEQWTVIRDLMRYHNPGLDDKLPPPQAPAVRRIEVEPPEFSGSKIAGESAQVRFRLHNRGNTTWLGDDQIRMIGVWQPLDPNAATAATWEWTRPLHDAVPPGGAAELRNLEDNLPGEPGERQVDWTVEGVGWEPPAEPVTLSSKLTVEPPTTSTKQMPASDSAGDEQRVQELLDRAQAAEESGAVDDAVRLTVEARQTLERLDDQPRLADVHNRLARLHLAQGDAQEAEAHALESVRIREGLGDPQALADSLRTLAQLYGQTFQGDKSVATWQRLVQLDGRNVDALLGLAGALLAAGRAQDALDASSRAAKLNSRSAAAQQGVGAAQQALGNFDAAEVAFRRAITLEPNNPQGYVALAYLYLDFADTSRAVEALQKAVEVAPKDAEVRSHLAWLYYRLGRLDDARAAFEACLARSQEEGDLAGIADYSLRLADIAVDQGSYDAASRRREESQRARVELQAQGKEGVALQQLWLLAAADVATWSAGNSMTWADARRTEELANLRTARPDDTVVLYDPNNQAMIGYGSIADKSSYSDANRRARQQTLAIRVKDRFFMPISRDELREAAPKLVYFNRPSSFTPITPLQWAIVRAWIVYRNPGSDKPDLPEPYVLPLHAFEVDVTALPQEPMAPGEVVNVSAGLRNRGNGVWNSETSFEIQASWQSASQPTAPTAPQAASAAPQVLTAKTSESLPPGARTLVGPLPLAIPAEPGNFALSWTVSSLDWPETVVAMPASVQTVTVSALETPNEPPAVPPAEYFPERAIGEPKTTGGAESAAPAGKSALEGAYEEQLDAHPGRVEEPATPEAAAGTVVTPEHAEGAAPTGKSAFEGAYEEQLDAHPGGVEEPAAPAEPGASAEAPTEDLSAAKPVEPPAEPEAGVAAAEEPRVEEPAEPPPPRPIAKDELAHLRLDAAVPPRVQVGAPFDLAVSVRLPDQPAPQAEALAQAGPGVGEAEQPEDVPSVSLRAEVIAEQCEIEGEPSIAFRLSRSGELPVLRFRLTPLAAGEIGMVVRVYQENELLGSARARTSAEEHAVGQVAPALQSEPVRPGALDLNRQPPPPPQAIDDLDADRKTTATVVYNNVWQSFVQSAERPRESFATRTLDVNIQPHYDNQVAEAERLLNAGQEDSQGRRYWVVLTLQEREDGRFAAPRYFEGPLKLDAFRSDFSSHERGDFRYGQSLFDTLFHADLPDNERRLTRGEPGSPTLLAGYISALASNIQIPLRIQLRIDSKAVELHNYQWEYLWDTATGARPEPMACSEQTPFSRILQVSGPGGQRPPHIDQQSRLRILAAMASPEELNPGWTQARTPETVGLQPIERAELEALAKGLGRFELIEKLQERNLLDGNRDAVTLEALELRLEEANLAEDRPVHVLHLLCHGLIGADGRSYVVLERAEGGFAAMAPEDLFAERIGRFVDPVDRNGRRRPGLRLVVLASCFTAKPTQGNSLRGIARRLVEAGVPAVVAMQHDFQYEAAQYFSQRLYAHLIHHGEIDRAVNAARLDLWDHRKRGPRDRDNPLRPDEWGVPVLFMRLADGRLFTVDPQASQLTDPDAPAEITPYADTPSGNPERLMQTTMRAAASQVGLNVGLDAMSLARAIGEAVAAVNLRPALPSAPAPQEVRLFDGEANKPQRWALVKAADEHRCHEARRTVLFLRSLARKKIAALVKSTDLVSLINEQTLRDEIWSGGSVKLDIHELRKALVGPGPDVGFKYDDATDASLASAFWRNAYRPQRPLAPGQTPIELEVHGNLVWPEDEHEYPNVAVDMPTWQAAASDLLFGSGASRFADHFKAFNAIVGKNVPGLDEQVASLLLHAIAPDDYVPHSRLLAQAVLDKIWPQGGSGYDFSYGSFCKLARDLLADDELGFENLADVAYFFQRLAAGYIVWQPSGDFPKDCLPALIEPVRLDHARLDSTLVVRESVMTQSVAALNIGKHVILTGPPGTGKTTLAEDICRHARDLGHCHGHVLVTATADWTTSDTIGGYMPEADTRLVFRPGVFLEAIRAGKWLVIDEINRADIDKSFGELFTVLSGQAVTLPYALNGRPVRILPPGWPASDSPSDYVIHRNWRIIGTMNVYDKASLFAMSYAFMRRFAFVEVPIPDEAAYTQLLERFLDEFGLADMPAPVKALLLWIFDSSEAANNPLMRWRALGPAIARDLIGYLSRRVARSADLDTLHLAEALSLYVVPQFDGLERDNIREVYDQLNQHFPTQVDGDDLMGRIRELFPYVRDWTPRPWRV